MTFQNPKIELHQWVNTILLSVVGFFVVQTYFTFQKDHERIAVHDTEIALVKQDVKGVKVNVNYLTGSVDELRRLKTRELKLSEAD